MEIKLSISTWDKETELELGKIMDNINRIMTENDFIFYEIAYKPSDYCIEVSANFDFKELIPEIVPEGWNCTYEYLDEYVQDFYYEDMG